MIVVSISNLFCNNAEFNWELIEREIRIVFTEIVLLISSLYKIPPYNASYQFINLVLYLIISQLN